MNMETPREASAGPSTGTYVQGSSWLCLEDVEGQQSDSLARARKQELLHQLKMGELHTADDIASAAAAQEKLGSTHIFRVGELYVDNS